MKKDDFVKWTKTNGWVLYGKPGEAFFGGKWQSLEREGYDREEIWMTPEGRKMLISIKGDEIYIEPAK